MVEVSPGSTKRLIASVAAMMVVLGIGYFLGVRAVGFYDGDVQMTVDELYKAHVNGSLEHLANRRAIYRHLFSAWCTLTFGAITFVVGRMGWSILRSGRLPPPGRVTAFSYKIRTGEDAHRYGVFFVGVSIVLALVTGMITYAWLIVLFHRGA